MIRADFVSTLLTYVRQQRCDEQDKTIFLI